MVERKLASIQRIANLEPIVGADKIEVATVLGWQVVVGKGDFQVGDLCVYCEVDSILPDRPEFEFLKARGMRIRTMKLRGQVSQGICFKLDVLPAPVEGLDVSGYLGVEKYDPPIPACLAGVSKGNFPIGFLPKTDETRVQTYRREIAKHINETCYITEKLDGSSVTYYLREGVFGVCSRNMDLLESESNSMWKWARLNVIEDRMRAYCLSFPGDFALQGEIIGPGIQGNRYGLAVHDVRFFSLIRDYEKVSYTEFKDAMLITALIPVPILQTDWVLDGDVPTLVDMSRGISILADVFREGIVIRTLDSKFSCKVINPDYSLKYGD